MFRKLVTLAVATLLAAAGTACASDSEGSDGGDGKLSVVAAFYPLQFVAEKVGGDAVEVTNLVPPGVESHDLELEPQQVGELSDADMVLYLGGFQPAVDEAVDQNAKDAAFDAAEVEPLEDGYVPLEEGELHEDEKGKDPHVWLDPVRFSAIATAAAEKLGEVDADNAEDYAQRADELGDELTKLDEEYRTGLANCTQKTIVVSHNSFGYLAKRYGLEQVPITGLTPEEEPSAARLAEVAKFAKDRQVTTIFFETLVSPKIAETLASDVGAKAAVLDPIEGLEADAQDGDYLSVMRENLSTLRSALGCT